MPIYVYQCEACGTIVDVLKKVKDIDRVEYHVHHCTKFPGDEGIDKKYPMKRLLTTWDRYKIKGKNDASTGVKGKS